MLETLLASSYETLKMHSTNIATEYLHVTQHYIFNVSIDQNDPSVKPRHHI